MPLRFPPVGRRCAAALRDCPRRYGGDDQARDVGGQQRIAVSRRLDAEHAGGGAAQVAAAQGVGQRLFVDQAATGGIDQEGARLHQRQFGGAEHPAGVLGQRAVQGQGVDPWQEFAKRQTVRPGGPSWQLTEQHAHAERLRQPRHRPAQFAMAEQAEGLAFQFDDGEVQQAELAGLLPAAAAYRLLVVRQARSQGQ